MLHNEETYHFNAWKMLSSYRIINEIIPCSFNHATLMISEPIFLFEYSGKIDYTHGIFLLFYFRLFFRIVYPACSSLSLIHVVFCEKRSHRSQKHWRFIIAVIIYRIFITSLHGEFAWWTFVQRVINSSLIKWNCFEIVFFSPMRFIPIKYF